MADHVQRCKTGKALPLPCQVALVLLFGISAHAAKNAIAPAEPMLHKMGLSPILYSTIASVPQVGCIFLPTLWGAAYRRYEKVILLIVPGGMLLGQVLLLRGFQLLPENVAHDSSTWAVMYLCLGLIIFSVFHGGAHVVQCTVLTRVLPYGLTSGFVGTIAVTHLIVAWCNFTVPWALERGGMIGVQVLLLFPAVISLLSGLALARIAGEFVVPHDISRRSRLPSGIEDGLLNDVFLKPDSDELQSPGLLSRLGSKANQMCLTSADLQFVYWLSIWKALEVGTLHSFRTVKNGLVVSFGLTIDSAGDLIGIYQTIALLLLPLAGVLFDIAGQRFWILSLSWCTALASAILSMGATMPDVVWMIGLFCISLAEVLLPVLPLALVPGNCGPSVGTSYGLLESSFSLAQVVLNIASGSIRQADGDGFHYAMVFFTATFALGGLSGMIVARRLKNLKTKTGT